MGSTFEELATRYDAWYDTGEGRLLFGLERACVRQLLAGSASPRLEVGVGSGRFAAACGLEVGLDPVAAPLRLAADRGVRSVRGTGERLPFGDHVFGAVALIVTLCFTEDPAALLGEARRVLRHNGMLVVGTIPADSAWGRCYEDEGRSGHPFYRDAHFLTLAEHLLLLKDTGFEPFATRSTLFHPPGDSLLGDEDVRGEAVPGAGFVTLAAKPRVAAGTTS